MYFSALRLSGFKSFLEPTELEIGPGLTGIVGPNGCGKSNLVEALRWVMGESSAKRMRGGEMDDVIFGGSDKRPARNLAEVSLVIDNLDRNAPENFNITDELEVLRRIERGSGSDYRVNGKTVRAKDVALLFQDSGTGPHSASLVSQGRIGAIINAKPTERRQLLEEAAGITGLHTRRHEAELRLKQAETNLTRMDDILGTMDVQLQLLKKQSRQASRYRNINAEVRRQEAALLHLRWIALHLDMKAAHDAFTAADNRVGELMLDVAKYESEREQAQEALPPLRQEEAAASAALQRVTIAREQIESERQRVQAAIVAAEGQAQQAEADRLREANLAEDALKSIQAIEHETADLRQSMQGADERRAQLADAVQKAIAARAQAETIVNDLQQRIARAEAEANAAERRLNDVNSRYARAEQRRAQLAADRAKIEAEPMSDLFVAAAHRDAETAEQKVTLAAATVEQAEAKRSETDTAAAQGRQRVQAAEAAVANLQAEKRALERGLQSNSGKHPPILDQVVAGKGFEQALAAALGEDLSLPTSALADVYWQNLPAYDSAPAWPARLTPLAPHISAPPELMRRLAFVAIAESAEAAATAASSLSAGQVIVTREGGLWRWDGVISKAGAPTLSALRLQQRNRLTEVQVEEVEAQAKLEAARQDAAAATTAASEAVQAVRLSREQHTQAMNEHNRLRRAVAEAEAALSAYQTRLNVVRESEERAISELNVIEAERSEVEQIKASLPDLSASKQELTHSREQLYAAQALAAEAESSQRQYSHELNHKTQRLAALESDRERWIERSQGASRRTAELVQRAAEARAEIEALSARPAALLQERDTLSAAIEEAEAKRRSFVEKLNQAEHELKERERLLKQAEQAMTDSREARATAQAQVGAVQQAELVLLERIQEKCECAPEQLFTLAELKEDEPLPDYRAIEQRLEKLLREREALGPVNLRAEQEADEHQGQIDKMQTEKADILEAIAKLRQGISSLNKEARERLIGAYDLVQNHFKTLFVSLFGGGTAELRLTDAEDPLECGLEIIASPPGKKLQNLNLLSGGEQALTSLALLFAVFLVNPSPICVLDEVDAPLDEANIDRFCTLLDHMVKEGSTRFLVITHQRLTMSRMDRLYGVTMMERGISTLVSVDLREAEELKGVA